MGKRKSGYYWVKIQHQKEWVIGRYWADLKLWDLMKKRGLFESFFEEIDETPITRNKN